MPVLCSDPERLVGHLRERGFDATRRATMQPLADDLPRLVRDFAAVVYLPFHADMSEACIDRLVAAEAARETA